MDAACLAGPRSGEATEPRSDASTGAFRRAPARPTFHRRMIALDLALEPRRGPAPPHAEPRRATPASPRRFRAPRRRPPPRCPTAAAAPAVPPPAAPRRGRRVAPPRPPPSRRRGPRDRCARPSPDGRETPVPAGLLPHLAGAPIIPPAGVVPAAVPVSRSALFAATMELACE